MTVALGTYVSIDATQAPEAEGTPNPLDTAMAVLDVIDARMHPTRAGSDLNAIAAASVGAPVKVHPWTFELLGLALEILGEFHELASRRIVPRQTVGQPQTSLGFVPEICRIQNSIHGWAPQCARESLHAYISADQSRFRRRQLR